MVIDKFEGEYRWLSNFWPVNIPLDGEVYPSVEHAYQAAKFIDKESHKRAEIRDNPDPRVAKRKGRTKGIRADWDQVKLEIMKDLLWKKFAFNSEFAEKLIATGDQELVEGNWWGDTYWGVCRGKGENHLGKEIMRIRETLKEGTKGALLP
jgi:N-glycosidase YbiA